MAMLVYRRVLRIWKHFPNKPKGWDLNTIFISRLVLAGCTFNQYHQNSCDLRYLFTFYLLQDYVLSSRFFYPSPHPKAWIAGLTNSSFEILKIWFSLLKKGLMTIQVLGWSRIRWCEVGFLQPLHGESSHGLVILDLKIECEMFVLF